MFDTRVHDYWEPPRCERSRALVDRMCASWRLEARVVAERLDAIGELFELRRAQRGEEADWAVDTWAAVGAEVAAAFQVSLAMAGSFLRYALAMRERLPQVAAVFRAGDIGLRLFQTLVYRTDLITDPEVLAAVDGELAMRAPRWPSMTRGRLAGEVDKVVARADVDAVRRREQCRAERGVWVEDLEGGMSEIRGGLFSPDGHALDRRLDALADTVCAHDPRSRDQLRADALGALAASGDRLGCRCGRADCAAAQRPATSPVVIHVVAERASVEGRGSAPGSELGADGLIPAEVIAELAGSARLVAVGAPTRAEPRYTPSAGLADFVRCRDLTCRAPGCDRPAVACDIDHTIPYAQGGPTHASNLKVLCRQHHLLKTFWGWRDEQLPDGTLIWRLPDGHTYVTTPGSALLFPTLCAPTGDPPLTPGPAAERCGQRTAMMPLRTRTRAQNRAQRIATERHHNRQARLTTPPAVPTSSSPPGTAPSGPAPPDDEPPPF